MCSLPDIEGRCDRVDELIWRSDAIKSITGEPIDAHYPSWYVDRLKEVPPANLDSLLQLLERLEPTFVCEEMMEDKKEEQVCANYCEYTAPTSECFLRYARMKGVSE